MLARVPESGGWVITAIADKSSPLVEESNGVVLFVRRKRYTLERAREAFRRLRRAIDEADFSRLDRLARTGEIDHIFFRRAFGLLTDAEAMVRKLENAAAMALWSSVERGEMSPKQFEISLRSAQLAFARASEPRKDKGGPPN